MMKYLKYLTRKMIKKTNMNVITESNEFRIIFNLIFIFFFDSFILRIDIF